MTYFPTLLTELQISYPSALRYFDKITDFASNKKIAIFLDYDGTLSPIVDDPDCAYMSTDVSGVRYSFFWAYYIIVNG